MQQFDFDIVYRPGKTNVVDALSRQPQLSADVPPCMAFYPALPLPSAVTLSVGRSLHTLPMAREPCLML